MTDDVATKPADIRQKGPRELAISWADGHESLYRVRDLRLACACAQCVDEWTGRGLLDDTRVPLDVHPETIRPVGRYAIQIDWSDGHATGIYSFRRLRDLCQCSACEAERRGPPPPGSP